MDELEKQLQEVKWKVERDSPSQELSNDGELSAEHRSTDFDYLFSLSWVIIISLTTMIYPHFSSHFLELC